MARYFQLCVMVLIAIVSMGEKNVAAKRGRGDCYGDLGSFDNSLPCNGLIKPQCPHEINTQFRLYTPENPSKPDVIDWKDNASIVKSNFQGNRRTKFIIHGFIGRIVRSKLMKMKDAFLSIGKFNVILVNWEDGAGSFDLRKFVKHLVKLPLEYEQSRQNTRLVGRQIAELSRKLESLTGASFASMHLIGHSLGAQVAGFAGEHLSRRICRQYGCQFGRITGLDPAGPGFQLFSALPGCLLEKSDAKFVDIIHTDGIVGNERAVGHQDFYPNGGLKQAGCGVNFICSHLQVIDYFTESITTKCSWRAYPCSSWIKFVVGLCKRCGKKGCSRMGLYADVNSKATGKFMVRTNGKEPFCKKGF